MPMSQGSQYLTEYQCRAIFAIIVALIFVRLDAVMTYSDTAELPSQRASSATSSLDEVKRMRGQLSLKLLRGLDECVDSIIFQTPFVTAYELSSCQQWERAEIEGFLFILVNRKSENHLIEYITPEFKMTLDTNYIFYLSKNLANNTMNNIRGLWFFDEKECLKTFEKIGTVIINREPLSGFNHNRKEGTASTSVPEESPAFNVSSTPIHPPAPSPNLSLSQSLYLSPMKKGYLHPGATVFQQGPQLGHMGNCGTEHCSGPISGFATQASPTQAANKEVERLVSFFHQLPSSENQSHSVKPLVPLHVSEPVQHTRTMHQQSRKPSIMDQTINVTYDMLSRAFFETIQSEDFVRLMWRRLGELGSRKSDYGH